MNDNVLLVLADVFFYLIRVLPMVVIGNELIREAFRYHLSKCTLLAQKFKRISILDDMNLLIFHPKLCLAFHMLKHLLVFFIVYVDGLVNVSWFFAGLENLPTSIIDQQLVILGDRQLFEYLWNFIPCHYVY